MSSPLTTRRAIGVRELGRHVKTVGDERVAQRVVECDAVLLLGHGDEVEQAHSISLERDRHLARKVALLLEDEERRDANALRAQVVNSLLSVRRGFHDVVVELRACGGHRDVVLSVDGAEVAELCAEPREKFGARARAA